MKMCSFNKRCILVSSWVIMARSGEAVKSRVPAAVAIGRGHCFAVVLP